MSATTTTAAVTRKTTVGVLLRDGFAATALASVATAAVAAAGGAAGISHDIAGEPIPLSGFAMLTAIFSTVGIVLAVALAKFARHPRRAFVRTTVVLTVLSLVPDAIVPGAAPATRVLLMLTHLVAAAIVIPAVARRLEA